MNGNACDVRHGQTRLSRPSFCVTVDVLSSGVGVDPRAEIIPTMPTNESGDHQYDEMPNQRLDILANTNERALNLATTICGTTCSRADVRLER